MPKIVDKEQRRQQLAQTAIELFSEHGFENVSIAQIAKAAGVAKGSIYDYFESREELIMAAIMVWMGEVESTAELILADIDDPEEKLRTFVNALIDYFINDPRAIKLVISMMHLALVDDKILERQNLLKEMFLGMRRLVISFIMEGISKGDFDPKMASKAESLTINLLAFLDGIALHHLMDRNYIDLKAQVNLYLDRLIDDLRGEK